MIILIEFKLLSTNQKIGIKNNAYYDKLKGYKICCSKHFINILIVFLLEHILKILSFSSQSAYKITR